MAVYESSRARKRKWWQRPIVWLLAVVVGAAGAYLTYVVR
jgi:hypothetical protein